MSFTKKVVVSYSKSLFQNVNTSKTSKDNFEVSKITSADQKSFLPNVYIIGEELVLLSSTLLTSKKVKEFFANPTYAEQQKLNVLLNIFPGLTVTTKSFLKVLTERGFHFLIIMYISLRCEVVYESNEILKVLEPIQLDQKTLGSLAEKMQTLSRFDCRLQKLIRKLTRQKWHPGKCIALAKVAQGLDHDTHGFPIDLTLDLVAEFRVIRAGKALSTQVAHNLLDSPCVSRRLYANDDSFLWAGYL
ncbi:MAG: hypothetical protein EBU93_07045, partial [Chlamydiae bacterium]|nr:hypothetical protein [Chlamydiota bacterium]